MLDNKEAMDIAVLLIAKLGLRRGEAVRLSWEDVDFEGNTIHISHSFDYKGNLRPTKTKAGGRYIPMSESVKDALMERMNAQIDAFHGTAQRQQKFGVDGFDIELIPKTVIVSDDYSHRILPGGLGHWWNKNRSRSGLEQYTLHELRRSFITNAIRCGVSPSVIQDLAGHASPEATMNIYTHTNMQDKFEAMEALVQIY